MKRPIQFRGPSRLLRGALRLTPVLLSLSLAGRTGAKPGFGAPGIAPVTSSPDTFWFGGTRWDAADMRWEALRDSVWTFETGVGSSINSDPSVKVVGMHRTMEGWAGHDFTDHSAQLRYLRRTGLCAISGSWSLHAGATEAEADSLCWVSGQGYGNNMAVQAAKSFLYPGSGAITLQYAYSVDAEAGFDYTYVVIDTTGTGSADPVVLRTHTGTQSGTASVALNRGTTLRSTPGPFRLMFQFVSDAAYSDEDGVNPTACGHSTIDNITLSGAVADLSTFEAGDNGWTVESPLVTPNAFFNVGDWSDLEALADLPDPGTNTCDFQDTVLVFLDPSTGAGGHPLDQNNVALSPWVDLEAQGVMQTGDLILEFEGYFSLPIANHIFVSYAVQWSPLVCGAGGGPTSEIRQYGMLDYSLPEGNLPLFGCTPPVRRLLSNVIPPEATAFRVGIGVTSLCRSAPFGPCSGITNTTPWVDNVRVGVVGSGPTGVPAPGTPPARAFLEAPRPNPLVSATGVALRFFLPAHGATRPTTYDVAGRPVRTVLDIIAEAGWTALNWDARDGDGQAVASGLYFVRFTAAGEKDTRKIVVQR